MYRKPKKMKGSILDIIPIMLVLFAVAVVSVFGYLFVDEFSKMDQINDTVFGEYIDKTKLTLTVFDSAILFLTFMIVIGTVIAAFFMRTHPIFFIIGVMLSVIMIFISAMLTNMFMYFVEAPEITAAANNMPTVVLIMQNLPSIVLIAVVFIFIALYAKRRSERSPGSI